MEQLSSEQINRTTKGIISTFGEIFTNARYISQSRDAFGKHYDEKPNELFLASEAYRGGNLPSGILLKERKSLYCTPSAEFMKPRFSPRIAPRDGREWITIPPACVKIIPWAKYEMYLVLAGDPNHIGDEWWGFVPFGQTFEVN